MSIRNDEMDPKFNKLIENLPFDVVAGPCRQSILDDIPPNSIGTPVNVRLRFRHKDDIHRGVISVPKLGNFKAPQKLRITNSDQTIMSFDFLMDSKTKEITTKKQKKVFRFFKPGICLTSQNDDDEYSYLPKTFHNRNTASSAAIVDVNTSGQPFDGTVQGPVLFFGKCKPGGCLDPPFGEEKYAYEPNSSINNNEHYKSNGLEELTQVSLRSNITQLRLRSSTNACYDENKLNDGPLITYPLSSKCQEAEYKHNSLRSVTEIERSIKPNSNIYLQSYYKPSKSKESSISSKTEDIIKQKIREIETITEPEFTYITKSASEDSTYRETGCPAVPVLPDKIKLSTIESHITYLQTNTECSIELDRKQNNANGSKQSIPVFNTVHQFKEYYETTQSKTTLPLPSKLMDDVSIKDDECKFSIMKLSPNKNDNKIQDRKLTKNFSDNQSIIVIAPIKELKESLNDYDIEYLPELNTENQPRTVENFGNKKKYSKTHLMEPEIDVISKTAEMKGLNIASSKNTSEIKIIKLKKIDNMTSKSPKNEEANKLLKDNLSLEISKKSIISANSNNQSNLYIKKEKVSANGYDQTLPTNQVSRQNTLLNSPDLKQQIIAQKSLLTSPNIVKDLINSPPRETSLLLSEIPLQSQEFRDNFSLSESIDDEEEKNIYENIIAVEANSMVFNKSTGSAKTPSKELIKNLSSHLKLIPDSIISNDHINNYASTTKKDSTTNVSVTLKVLTSPTETVKSKMNSENLSVEIVQQEKKSQNEILKIKSEISKGDITESIYLERNINTQLSRTILENNIDIPVDLQKINIPIKKIIKNYDHQPKIIQTKSDNKKNSEAKDEIQENSMKNKSFNRDNKSSETNIVEYQIKTNEHDSVCDVFEFDFAIECYVNNNKEKVFKTIDTAVLENDRRKSILRFNGILRLDEDEIKLPIDRTMNMIVTVKKNRSESIEVINKKGL